MKRILIPAILLICFFGYILLTASPQTPTASATAPVQPVSDLTVDNLLSSVNSERTKAGLVPFTQNPGLAASAAEKCADMATYNYWAHDNPNGTLWETFVQKHVDYESAGENLAHAYTTAGLVVTGWLNSPAHRANMLNSEYTDVGYALCSDETLKTIVVQHMASFR